LGFRLVLAP